MESAVGSLTCPYAPFCNPADGCHGGIVLQAWSRRVELVGGVWRARTWGSPQGPDHECQPAAMPELERPPKWARWLRRYVFAAPSVGP